MTSQFVQDDREWLEPDGLGGFASGTVCGARPSRYHALLLVATTPPTGRVVLVNGLMPRTGTFSPSPSRTEPTSAGWSGGPLPPPTGPMRARLRPARRRPCVPSRHRLA